MNNSESMLNELIKGIGMTTELWMITYGSFKKQKLSDEEAIEHTKACMSVILHEMMAAGKEKENDQS